MNTFYKLPTQVMLALIALLALMTPVRPVYANPDTSSAGGTFWVSVSDKYNSDIALTLSEAILLANGGTGPNGLNRELETGEVLKISGCHMAIDGGSGKAVIIDGCGEGVSDTIRFSIGGGDNVFEIQSTLPALNDSQPTIIDGSGFSKTPIIDLSQNQMTQGLTVNSSNNVIKNITIRGGRCNNGVYCPALYGLGLNGHNNQVSNISLLNIQGDGMFIEGEGNVIDAIRVGVPAGNINICPPFAPGFNTGVTGDGIYFSTGAKNNTVKNSVIGCNGIGDNGAGIAIRSGNQGTVIGPNNRIGTNGSGATALLNNFGSGIELTSSENVTIISNTIAYNTDAGISLINASNNTVAGNVIRNNSGEGLLLISAANNNKIGGPTQGSVYGGNKIVLNGGHGILLQAIPIVPSIVPLDNRIVGNWIGTLNGVDVAGNEGSGIVLEGANHTEIGDPDSPAPNIIGGNQGYGIWLVKAAHDNEIANTYVGTNGYTPLPNNGSGIVIEDGAHHNLIGGGSSSAGNTIAFNDDVGVLIRGDGTSNNSLASNTIAKNGLDGVLIANKANNNNVGGLGLFAGFVNRIFDNGRAGVQIAGEAQYNLVGGNHIYANAAAGVLFSGANTQHNSVKETKIYANLSVYGDGIGQEAGADQNFWSHISTYDNTGMGIDLKSDESGNRLDGPYPTITNIAATANQVTVTGTAMPSNGQSKQVTVELYRVADDPSGNGEGQTYVASGATDANGNFTISFDGVAGCFTAFQTIKVASGQNSSEFGPNACKGTPQTITFAAIPAKVVSDPPIQVNPTASSGLPVTLMAEGPCTVAQMTVTITGDGLCVLTAQQPGDSTYAPAADKIVQFEISKKTQSITWELDGAANSHLVNEPPFGLNAIASSGLPVSFVAQGVCTVNGNTVTLTSEPGSCSLVAQQAGNTEYLPATEVQKSFEVSKIDQTLTFNPLPDQQTNAPAFVLSASASSGLPVKFSATGVCSVDSVNLTLSGQSGLCTVIAYQEGDETFNPAPEIVPTFNVTNPAKQLQTITFATLADKLLGDVPFAISATASSGLPVSFTPLTPGICLVDGTMVTLLAAGLCTLEAAQPGDATFNAATSVSLSFVVADPAKQTQTITFATITDKVLGDAPVAVSATASSGLPVTVESQTPTICSVNGDMLTLVTSGSCTLVAAQPGDATFNPAAPVTRTFLVQPTNQPDVEQMIFLPLITR